MNNQYIQQQLKRSLKPPESISAFRSIVGNTKRVFTVLTFWFCTNYAARNLFITNLLPIHRCCHDLEAKANMFCIVRASSQTQSNWKECSGSGSGSGFSIRPFGNDVPARGTVYFIARTPCEAWRNTATCSVLWISQSPSKVLSLWYTFNLEVVSLLNVL